MRWVTVSLLALAGTPAFGAVVYVNKSAPGPTFDGASWATAFTTVTAGLNAAVSGDEVWVAAGTYVERITLKDGVALYGGFAGTETAVGQRNWVANITLLDGGAGGSVVTSPAGTTATCRIDGFVIRNGAGNSGSAGGGITCVSSSSTIANNIIENNSALAGAGIHCRGASPTITNNTIRRNVTTADGGGIYCVLPSSPIITQNTIAGNTAEYGGGISAYVASPVVTRNRIIGNHANSYAGGVECYLAPTMRVTNNIIAGNSAVRGGGMTVYGATDAISNNTLMANHAPEGAIWCGGSTSSVVANNIVASGTSGIYLDAAATTPALRNNCVFDNGGNNFIGPGVPSEFSNNIQVSPVLADTTFGNLHIQPNSPCRNAGDGSLVAPGELDMDGEPRMQLGVDIGADESDGTLWSDTHPIIRVSPTGNDANDGSSWVLAKQTLQAGVDQASTVGGELWAQAGIYREQVLVLPFAHLYAGFRGDETDRSQRDWVANRVIIDTRYPHGDRVTMCVGLRSGALDGFTIRNGRSSLTSPGTGIVCFYSSPTIANCTVRGNTGGGIVCSGAVSPNIMNNVIVANGGAGLSCNVASPAIVNNTIVGNGSNAGAGIYCVNASPSVVNNVIAFGGSGVNAAFGSSPTFRNNCVYGNEIYNYSGVADPTGTNGNISADPTLAGASLGNTHIQPVSPCRDAGDSTAVLPGSTDMDAQSRIQGARVDIGADESDGTSWTVTPMIMRISPNGNDSNDGSTWALAKRTVQAGIDAVAEQGGEVWVQAGTYQTFLLVRPFMYLYGGFAGMESERWQRNWRSNPTVLDGGAFANVVWVEAGHRLGAIDGFTIRNGTGSGGIACLSASLYIRNNVITSHTGHGIYCSGSVPYISNNRISNNTGSGIYCTYSDPAIVNNTLTDNMGAQGGGLYCSVASPVVVNNIVAFGTSGIYSSGGTPTLRNNCVFGNGAYNYSGLLPGPGDISADPVLVNRAGNDYHPSATSPCVDAGDSAAVQPGATDLDGKPRLLGPAVDMGAYETVEDSSGPVTGAVSDGTGADVDSQASATALSANWSGFGDPESGIAGYRWAIGTTPGGEDVQPFTSVGLNAAATNSNLSLAVGTTYYVFVEASNWAWLTTTATSDGVLLVAPPAVASTPVASATAGAAYTYDVDATGFPAPAYALTAAPSGMTLQAASGMISWTPTVGQAGDHSVTVVASNGVSPDATQTFTVTVTVPLPTGTPPSFTSTPVTAAAVGTPYSYDANAIGNPTPTYSLSSAPVGMVINGTTGLISWTPASTQTGARGVTVVASNGVPTDAIQTFTITVSVPLPSGTGPTITTTPVTGATSGVAYSYDVNAIGNPTPLYSLGTVPTGMLINAATGLISWTPASTQVGSNSVMVIAANGILPDAVQSFSITVTASNQPPSVSLTNPTAGQTFAAPATIDLIASASDPDGTVTLVEFYQGAAKLGEDADGSDGHAFTWSNMAGGSYSLTARATDNAGAATTSGTVTITVSAGGGGGNQFPTVSIAAPAVGATFTAPANIAIDASASDPDGSIVRVEFYAGATRLGEDTTAPYSFAWSNVSAGTYSLTARATDNAAAVTTSNAVAITVNAEGGGTAGDVDADGLPDAWETTYFVGLAQNGSGDPDGDGLLNQGEYVGGTNPALADTDADGMRDGGEVAFGLNPLTADQNANGVADGQDDWDGDGVSNQAELAAGTPPGSPQSAPPPAAGGGGGGGGGGCFAGDVRWME